MTGISDGPTVETLDADTIRDYLLTNPDFIREDAELFALLAHRDTGEDIIDLGAAARSKLLAELRQLKSLNSSIIETARANLATQSQIHMAVLALLAWGLILVVRRLRTRLRGSLRLKTSRERG